MLYLMDIIAIPVHSSEVFGCFLSPDRPSVWGPKHAARSRTRGSVLSHLHWEAVTGHGSCVSSGGSHPWQVGLGHFSLPGTAEGGTGALTHWGPAAEQGLGHHQQPLPCSNSTQHTAAAGTRGANTHSIEEHTFILAWISTDCHCSNEIYGFF